MLTNEKVSVLTKNITSSLVPNTNQINITLQEMLKARNNFEKFYNETTILLFKNCKKELEYKINKGELPHLCGLKNIKKECLNNKKEGAYKKLKQLAGVSKLNMVNIFDIMLDNQNHFLEIQSELNIPLIEYKKVEAKSEVFRKLNPLFANEVIYASDNKSKFSNVMSPANTYIVQNALEEDLINVTHYLLGFVMTENENYSNTIRVEKNRMNGMNLEKYDGLAIKYKKQILFISGNVPLSYKKNYLNNQLGSTSSVKIKKANKNEIRIYANNNIINFINNNLKKSGTSEIATVLMDSLEKNINYGAITRDELILYLNRTFNENDIKYWDMFNYVYAIKNNSESILKNPYWSKRRGRNIMDEVDTLADYVTFTSDAEGIVFTKRSLFEFIKTNDFNKILKYMNYRKYFTQNFRNKDTLINYMHSYLEFIKGEIFIGSIEELINMYVENVIRIKNNIKEDYRKYDKYER